MLLTIDYHSIQMAAYDTTTNIWTAASDGDLERVRAQPDVVLLQQREQPRRVAARRARRPERDARVDESHGRPARF